MRGRSLLAFIQTIRVVSSAAIGRLNPAMASTTYYRKDGVRITHDPYAKGMAEKYGRPGSTDDEGFDPYADTVGAGIYGGIVKRATDGQIVIGKQYQDHNPRPGPVYAGGGYTPITKSLKDISDLKALLDKFPDLVNDVSTGGALPLHNCGMSKQGSLATETVILRGGDIEALDTYGFTPLQRMASNNLAVGAKALLEAGADPRNKGGSGSTPLEIARGSRALDVIRLLTEWGTKRRNVKMSRVECRDSGFGAINGVYSARPMTDIPPGFADVCVQNEWDTGSTWSRLGGGSSWFGKANGSYIYFNEADGHWWIDGPDGGGVFKSRGPSHAIPAHGWTPLRKGAVPPPNILVYRGV